MLTILGVISGLGVAAGVLLLIRGLTPAPETSTPRASGTAPGRSRLASALSTVEKRWALLALAAGTVLALVTGWVVAIILAPVMAVGVPRLIRPPQGVSTERLEGIEEWVRSIHGLLANSLPLGSAIQATLPSAPEPIRGEVTALVSRLQARRSLEESLYAFADDLGDQTGDFVASALIEASRSAGAGLTRSLDALAVEVADEVRMRRDIQIERQKSISQAKWLTMIICIGVPAFVLLTNLGAAYRTGTGQLVLLALSGMFAGCLLWVRRTATTRPPARFLVTPQALGGDR